MAKKDLNDKKWNSLVQDHKTIAELGIDIPFARVGAGRYNAADPTLDEGDFGFLRVTQDGKLMVDTELTLDGSVIINNLGGAAAKDAAIAGNPVQIGIEVADFDGAALPGAVDAEGDVTYPKGSLSGVLYTMPVNEDGSLTTIYGEDVAHADGDGGTFVLAVRNDALASLCGTDGDYAPFQVDANGALYVSDDAVTYAEDAAHTSGEEGIFVLGIRTDLYGTAINIAGTSGDYQGLQMNAKGGLYTDLSSVLGADMSVTNGAFTVITDNTTAASVSTAYGETAPSTDTGLNVKSVMYGFDSESLAATQLKALQIAVDNEGLSATPNVAVTGGIYKAASDTYNDNDAVPFHFDVDGKLIVAMELNDYVDDSAFAVGVDKILGVGLLADELVTDTVDEGDIGIPRMTLNRQAIVTPRLTDGNEYAFDTGALGATVPRMTLATDDPAVASLAIMDDWDATHDSAVVADGATVMFEAKDVDGAALPNDVQEGDAVRPAASLYGVQLGAIVSEDGSTIMPTGDAVGRSIFTAIGDGTTTCYVNPSTAGTEDEAQPGIRTDSVLMGYDPSAVANSQLKAVHVVTDNAATNATPNALITGGVYKNAFDTYADNDASPLHMDVNGKLFTAGVYAEDAAHTDADWGMHILTVRDDSPVAKAGTDGDYQSLTTDDVGALWSRIRGYDTGTDSNKVFEVNPISEHHVEETLAEVTNGTDGTYNYYIDMDGYRNFSLDMDIDGGSGTCTVKVYASNQDDGNAVGSIGLWHDVTSNWFGAASYTADDWVMVDTNLPVKWVKVEVVAATGAADDADWDIYAKKMY